MKLLCCFLVAAFLCSALAQDCALPNLNINNDPLNCSNYRQLLATAQADLARLNKFVTQDLVAVKTDTAALLVQLNRVCGLVLAGPGANPTLLQVQKSSKLTKTSINALQDFSRRLQRKERGDLYKLLVADQFDDMMSMLETDSRQCQDTYCTCADIRFRVQVFLRNVDSISQQLLQTYINGVLPQRIANATALQTQCTAPPPPPPSNAPMTLTGTAERVYWTMGGPMRDGANYLKVDDSPVVFSQAFDTVPSVGLALTGDDINENTPSFSVEPVNITTTGFTLRVTAKPGVALYLISVSYIATVSSRSGIYIVTNTITQEHPGCRRMQQSTDPVRSANKEVSPPNGVNLQNLKSLAFIRDYDFLGGRNTRLSVSINEAGNNVTYTAYQDAKLNGANVTVIYWSGNDRTITTRATQTEKNGPLSRGQDQRDYAVTFDISAYSGLPEGFYGFSHYEVLQNSNYRIRSTLNRQNPTSNVTYTSWYVTSVDQVKTNILFACQKGNCLRN